MSEGESWKVQLPNTIPVNFPETEMEIVHKFQKLHPDIDLPMYGMHKILELCVNVLTQDEYSKTSPYSRITNTGEIRHRRINKNIQKFKFLFHGSISENALFAYPCRYFSKTSQVLRQPGLPGHSS